MYIAYLQLIKMFNIMFNYFLSLFENYVHILEVQNKRTTQWGVTVVGIETGRTKGSILSGC